MHPSVCRTARRGRRQIPLPGLEQHRGCWANLSVDLAGLTSMCFKADAFKALDLLTVAPVCKVRKIFTMRGALDQQNGLDEGRDPVTGVIQRAHSSTVCTTPHCVLRQHHLLVGLYDSLYFPRFCASSIEQTGATASVSRTIGGRWLHSTTHLKMPQAVARAVEVIMSVKQL